ncbi:unnamed protein product [Acanthoscelides obtectus]|uniref:Major facilitator superfamily (MFS) profile domain-containing protein n=1 Tax=Acanthoscelides obtectus TaxID=200917 RepID=A0A9P0PAE7_ACAOB|nr:unnamed protein product [Acanthoscelides obtectus]CAK1639613.1 Facilitated trehalose transporter Tret1 [Acanthoscelides obtectus]
MVENDGHSEVVYKPTTKVKDKVLLENQNKQKDSAFLYFTATIVSLVSSSGLCSYIWMSPALAVLKLDDQNLNPIGRPVTPFEESIIGGIWLIGSIAGNLMLGKLPDIFGRKKIMILISILMIIGYSVLAFSSTIYIIYIARLITGIAFGMYLPLLSVYLFEISESHNRGKFGSFICLFLTLSSGYVFLLATFFSLKVFTFLCALPAALCLLCFLFVPETPMHLVSKGDRKGATKALRKLRGRDDVRKEVEEIESLLNECSRGKNKTILEALRTPGLKRALFLAVSVNSLQQLIGQTAILGYLTSIFVSAGISPDFASIISCLVQLPSTIIAAMLVDKLGRRVLLLISLTTYGTAIVLLGVYFYLKHLNFDFGSFSWLPVASVILMFIGYCIGMGVIPIILASEVLPNDIKSVGMSITVFCAGVFASVTVFGFPIVMEYLGLYWCFWICGIVSFLAAIFVYYCVPETKGKSVAEIQKMLNS